MTNVTNRIRQIVYQRDGFRCVACGTTNEITFQHRAATGMGGRGKKAPPLNASDGLTLCLHDNQDAEAGGQYRALAMGWKIRRNRGLITSHEIPYFDYTERVYFLPTVDGMRSRITHTLAVELLDAAGNLNRKVA